MDLTHIHANLKRLLVSLLITRRETTQDVEDYLSALRQQLEEAIASNVRIEIL